MAEQNKFNIEQKKGYFVQTKDGCALKGTVSRIIPESGFMLKTLYPTKIYYVPWKAIKSAKKSEMESDKSWSMSKDSINGRLTQKIKDAIIEAEKIKVSLRGDSVIYGKALGYYLDMIKMESEYFKELYFYPEDISMIEDASSKGRPKVICSSKDEVVPDKKKRGEKEEDETEGKTETVEKIPDKTVRRRRTTTKTAKAPAKTTRTRRKKA